MHFGGGFGRRGKSDFVIKAVLWLLAKQIQGVSVKLLWSRVEDQRQLRFHPMTAAKIACLALVPVSGLAALAERRRRQSRHALG